MTQRSEPRFPQMVGARKPVQRHIEVSKQGVVVADQLEAPVLLARLPPSASAKWQASMVAMIWASA